MKLPKKITPCPIEEALVEVRFKPNFPEDAIFGIIYSYLKEKYSKVDSLPILDLPEKIRKREKNLKYKPYHKLRHQNYILQLGPRVISLSVKKDYPGWDTFYKEINWLLERVSNSEIINEIERYSLRYINLFKDDIFKNIDLKIVLNQKDFHTDQTFLKSIVKDDDTRTILQIANNVTLGDTENMGSIIDVDVISTQNDPNFIANNKKQLDKLHLREKKVFFPLLTDEYLSSLDPIY